MPPKFSMIKLMRQKLIPQEQNVNFVLQDFGFKLQDLKGALEIIHNEAEVYPSWLCPRRGVTEEVPAVGFCLGSGLFGSYNSD